MEVGVLGERLRMTLYGGDCILELVLLPARFLAVYAWRGGAIGLMS